MRTVKDIVISIQEPSQKGVGWLQPVEGGTFKLKFYGPSGWADITSSAGVNNGLRQFGEIIPKTLAQVQSLISDRPQLYTEYTTHNSQIGDTAIMLISLTDLNNQAGILVGVIDTLTEDHCIINWKSIICGSQGISGKSVISINLTTDGAGQLIGGTATLSDRSSAPITISKQASE